ncbi:MAG: hypothetical protein IKN85_05690 [Oscillospiraceae bacterium]|nr:hypothetical protein [Oscillospiraceae bacterium]MBR6835063.1 hypothetical protein [Oscillospiraceae bacterium]
MKNKSKRIVSAVTAFCLAGSIINTGITFPVKNSGVVFAEPDGSADNSTAVKRIMRQSVCVLGGLTSLTNGMITLYYDSEMVSVKDIKMTSQFSGMTVSINDDVPGRIVVGFASVNPKNVIDDLFYVDYEYSTDLNDIPQFGIRVNELETEDKDGNIIEVDKELITASEVTSFLGLAAENVYTDTDVNGNISIDLNTYFLPLAPVTNGECTVIYDPEVMQFVSSEQVYDKNSVLIDMNETEPGKLKITFASAENIGDTILSRLYFKPLKNTVSEVVLKTDELTGVVAEDYILSYTSSGDYGAASSFGIDIPEVSDRLQFNRKGTFRVGTDGKLSVTNGILTVNYDTDKLEFKDIRLSEAIKGAAVNTEDPGKIVIEFASADPIVFDEVIADIDFAFPAGLAGNLDTACWVSVGELESKNEDGTAITVDRENIFYYPLNPQYDLEMKKAGQSDEIEAVIKLERNQGRTKGVTNGNLSFYFDPEVLEFSGVSLASGQNGLLADANETAPGKISCVFVSDSPVTTDGEFLVLKFKPLRTCWTKVELALTELMNTVSEDEIYEYSLACGGIISYYNVELPEPAAPAEAESFDVSGDGAVNTLDLLKLIKIVIDPNAANTTSADLNGDGKIDSADVLVLKKILMK